MTLVFQEALSELKFVLLATTSNRKDKARSSLVHQLVKATVNEKIADKCVVEMTCDTYFAETAD